MERMTLSLLCHIASAPANDVQWRKAILMDHAEMRSVSARILRTRMRLKRNRISRNVLAGVGRQSHRARLSQLAAALIMCRSRTATQALIARVMFAAATPASTFLEILFRFSRIRVRRFLRN